MFNLFGYQSQEAAASSTGGTAEEVVSVGAQEIRNTEFNYIKHCGPIKIIGSKILSFIDVVGPVEIEYSTIHNLSVAGLVKISNSKVGGNFLKVAGYVKIMHSQVGCKTTLGSNRIDLVSSTLQTIEINNTNSHDAIEILTLRNSVVDGDIIFTSGKGEVKSYSSRLNGRLIGGVMAECYDNPEPAI